MGCSGCGKRKNINLKKFDAPMIDASGKVISNSFLSWSEKNRKERKGVGKSASKTMLGGMVDINKPKNIQTLPRVPGRINIMENSKNEKGVYIIGHFKGCSACKYMHRLIDRAITPMMKLDISFYSIEKNDVQPNGFEFRNNPTIVFVDQGKVVKQISGMNPQIDQILDQFYNNKKEKATSKKKLEYRLSPEPTHMAAYEKLFRELEPKLKEIKNISTSLDQKNNLLVVTVIFK